MSSRDDIKQEKENSEKKIEKNEKDEEKTKKENNNNKEDKGKLIEFNKLDIIELSKKPKSTDFFLLKKKRLLELNSLSFSSLDSRKNRTNKTNSNSLKSNKNSGKNNSENIINEEEYIDYNNESIDYIEEEQINILEEMFIEAKNSENENENENKINLFLEIVDLDETKEKLWAYKCFEEICLLYMESEEHEHFTIYYIKLREIAHLIEEKKMRSYVKFTAEKFVQGLSQKEKESINHWLEDIAKDFNINQQDKVINAFEANINLNFLLLANKIKSQVNEGNENNNDYESKIDINVIDYIQDKQKLEELTTQYLINECGCDPKYLDSKGNTFFYYQPPNCQRGGERYNLPLGWIGFGLEVLNRYGNDNWLGKDGKEGEWAVAYHGFGRSFSGDNLKKIN